MKRDSPTWILTGVAVLLVAVTTCSTPGSQGPRTMVSRSRVLSADSVSTTLHPVQRIALTVSARATYDAGTGLWTYAYSVTNEPASENALDTFALAPMREPERIVTPPHWMGRYGSEGESTAVAWSVADAGPAPAGWNGAQLFQGPYHPTPGQTVPGFAIVSRQGPTSLKFYAQGFDTLQTGGEEGVESAPSTFVEGVTGTTIGPGISAP